jgi:alpha-galactosidase
MLSKGTFLPLYTYGYDLPEAYVIQKDRKMYYAFFVPSTDVPWKGEVELRGLAPGPYRVFDYANEKDLGMVEVTANQTAKLKTEFKEHLLLEVSPQ